MGLWDCRGGLDDPCYEEGPREVILLYEPQGKKLGYVTYVGRLMRVSTKILDDVAN